MLFVWCRYWFVKFSSLNFSLKDEQRSGRRSEIDDNDIKALFESDRLVTAREMRGILIAKIKRLRSLNMF